MHATGPRWDRESSQCVSFLLEIEINLAIYLLIKIILSAVEAFSKSYLCKQIITVNVVKPGLGFRY